MEVNQSNPQHNKKAMNEIFTNNFSFEDNYSPQDTSRKNSINISYYFPGNTTFEDKESNSFININNLNDAFCRVDLNTDKKNLQKSEFFKDYEPSENTNSSAINFKLKNDSTENSENSKISMKTQFIPNIVYKVPYLPLPRFFVIKSVDEDNIIKVSTLLIIKSIRYNLWCSTFKGNQKLNKAFIESDNRYPIYLLFSVNGSGKFMGLAQMTSEVDYNANFNLWSQGDKWKGFFFVVWLIIKDVPNKAFRHLTNDLNECKPITSSRDTQEISSEVGMEVLKIFKEYSSESSLLEENFLDKKTQGFQNDSPWANVQEKGNNTYNSYNRSSFVSKMNINSEEFVPKKTKKAVNYNYGTTKW